MDVSNLTDKFTLTDFDQSKLSITIDMHGSGRVYDQRLPSLGLGGLVYTSSRADETERVIIV